MLGYTVRFLDRLTKRKHGACRVSGLGPEICGYMRREQSCFVCVTTAPWVSRGCRMVFWTDWPCAVLLQRLSVSSGLTVASSRRRGGVRGMAGAGTDGCTNLQLGHAGEDLQSMTRRWQLTHGTATIGPNESTLPPPPAILASSSATAAAPPELALPAPTWKVDGIVEMLSSRSRLLLPPCSSMGLTQLFLMVFLFRSRHCSQSMGRGSLRWRSRLAWDTASSQAKCFLLFLLPSSLLPSDSDDDELLPAPTPKPSNVGPRESSGCTSIDPILNIFIFEVLNEGSSLRTP
uniref:Uncharacterized protein n=1 Tax=Oryza meridionalis TaxID=40149 RepID=A0A0E0F4U6_9ORYZ